MGRHLSTTLNNKPGMTVSHLTHLSTASPFRLQRYKVYKILPQKVLKKSKQTTQNLHFFHNNPYCKDYAICKV